MSIVTSRQELLQRVNKTLADQDKTVIAWPATRESAADPIDYECFEVTLSDKGKVRRIDLIALAKQLGHLEDYESVPPTWYL